MRRAGFIGLFAFALWGCEGARPLVYVDLSKVSVPETTPSPARISAVPSADRIEGQELTLSAMRGAELALSDTRARLENARRLIVQNQDAARRSLAAALFRAYSREAEVARTESQRKLEADADSIWRAALDEVSEGLKEHAADRFPLATRLAFLLGFPFSNPAESPRPEGSRRQRRYDEAVEAWKKLLAEDREFAAFAAQLMQKVEAKIAEERVQIQIEFSTKLNEFAEKAREEADAAVTSNLPDFSGTLVERSDLTIPAEPEKTVSVPPVAPPSGSRAASGPTRLERREFLEHELSIWLAQNGYRRAASPTFGADRTKEFADWIKTRQAGL